MSHATPMTVVALALAGRALQMSVSSPYLPAWLSVQVQGRALEDSLQRRGSRLNDTAGEHVFVPAGQ